MSIEQFSSAIVAFLATSKPDRARKFYGGLLGLRLVSDDQFALAFDAGGTTLRIQKVESFEPHSFTALGWVVNDIRQAVRNLGKLGARFERYAFLDQDDLGIWQAPSGAKVAWFKDPDGNLLSLSEHQTNAAGK